MTPATPRIFKCSRVCRKLVQSFFQKSKVCETMVSRCVRMKSSFSVDRHDDSLASIHASNAGAMQVQNGSFFEFCRWNDSADDAFLVEQYLNRQCLLTIQQRAYRTCGCNPLVPDILIEKIESPRPRLTLIKCYTIVLLDLSLHDSISLFRV